MTDAPAPANAELVHASCVAITDRAVLIMGPSGSGKSDLALRLIDRGAVLVSDDYTHVRASEEEGAVIAAPPATIAGRIEVRGLGILSLPWRDRAPVAMIAALSFQGEPPIDRLPLTPERRMVCGREIPLFRFNAFEASAPVKLEHALKACVDPTYGLMSGTDS